MELQSAQKKQQYFNKNFKNPFSNVHERKIYIKKLQISIYQSLIDCIFKPAVHAIITCFIFSDRLEELMYEYKILRVVAGTKISQ